MAPIASILALTLVLLSNPFPAFSQDSFSSVRQPHHPAKRTYDSDAYYVVEINPSSSISPSEIARVLGTELVEQVGELKDHWLVKAPKELAEVDDYREGDLEESSGKQAGRQHSSSKNHGAGVVSRRSGGEDKRDLVMERWHSSRRIHSKKSVAPGHHLASRSTNSIPKRHLSSIRSIERQVPRQRTKRHLPYAEELSLRQDGTPAQDLTEFNFITDELGMKDPMLNVQWHIVNTLDKSNELNVTQLWHRGVTGKGVHVALIDDGLDYTSLDLKDNFYAEGSYDFNDHEPLPFPKLSDDNHGTRCAGEISAVSNDVCGVGVAYQSKVAGVRILSGPISDADEAASLNYGYQETDIYSCSWGPPDDGRSMDAPEGLIIKAIVNGVTNGRGGKGSIYVFAAGNGGGHEDQCNFDGYTNSIYSITIGAVDRKGYHPYYSESCAAMMAVAYSSGSGDFIHTTDVGENKCSGSHGGTSAAAPLAAGVYALGLQVRPELTWRDVQHLTVRASEHFNMLDPDWETTGAGYKYSYKYGYGKINAGLFVEAAETWKLVKPQAWYTSPAVTLPPTEGLLGAFITEEGVTSTISVSQRDLIDNNFERLEHVTVQVWIDHARRGDVEVEITSPMGTTSMLIRSRRLDEDPWGFQGWKFMTLKHWDENPIGDWTIRVFDRFNPEKNGTFNAWDMMLWGESIDASIAVPYVLPGTGDEEEEPLPEPSATETSSTLEASSTKQYTKPTEHLPGDHGTAEGEADHLSLPVTTIATTEAGPEETLPVTDNDDTTLPDEGTLDGVDNLSSNGSWVFGAFALILLVGAAAGVFFLCRARRRSRSGFGGDGGESGSGGGYGLVPGEEDMAMGMLAKRGQRRGSRSGQGKSKDLYDAFGDASSEEEEDLDDENTALRYHDSFLDDDDRSPNIPEHNRLSAEEKDSAGSGSGSGGSWQDAGSLLAQEQGRDKAADLLDQSDQVR